MKPRRTTRSQTMNSTTGPMKGRARSQRGLRGGAAAACAAGGAQGLARRLRVQVVVVHRVQPL